MSDFQEANTFISQQVDSARLFFLDADEADDFAVVFGGFESCGRDYRIDREDLPWYCLEFVSRGHGSVRLGKNEQVLRPGSFFLYGPGIPHQISTAEEAPMGKYFVGFSGVRVLDFLQSFGMEPGVISRCMKMDLIRRTFDALIDRGVRKSRLALPLCNLLTKQLLMLCQDDAADLGNTESIAFSTFSRVKKYIEKNYLQLSKLDSIAKACEVDGPYLCRLFSRFHDESPYQFLTRLRMEYASSLLLESDLTVKQVSANLGFKDAFHFSRVFKSVHHAPPSRFRQSVHPQWPM
ncbi:MAG: AraC family transcriptional regulator [Verrucomicrobia bacterium]|nr:MAG: AraC family transcriptional regulator [Verrucomicrobiota bacterium]